VGMDMMIMVIWTNEGRIETENAKKVIRERLRNEDRRDVMGWLNEWVGNENMDPLTVEVILADPSCKELWVEKMGAAFDHGFEEFKGTFESREVSTVQCGPLVGYVTGGATWGDSPTSVWDEWNAFLFDEDMGYGNPYGRECYEALGFVSFRNDYVSVGSMVADITISRKTSDHVSVSLP